MLELMAAIQVAALSAGLALHHKLIPGAPSQTCSGGLMSDITASPRHKDVAYSAHYRSIARWEAVRCTAV